MNGKNKLMKKNNKKSDFKAKKLHGKTRKNGFQHGKNKRANLKNGISHSKEFQYTPEVGKTPPVEVQFAKKLAANEPIIRDRAIKKLKKWLMSRSSMSDAADLKPTFNRSEMLRLWKGLHYCFWMSDKPLVQEELAEKIASLIHCFKADEVSADLYLECFLVTLGREWIGIDKHRMDKFMLLTRRIIRQSFVYAAKKSWDGKLIENMANKFESVVLSANRKSNAVTIVALGFQLHFTDIYLEELAKASKMSECDSKQSLTDESVQLLLRPFVNELAQGKEDRLLSQIENRIFDHLIRQSDVAIAYEDDEEEIEEEIGHNSENDNSIEQNEAMEDNEEEPQFCIDEADPRAGKGDVIIPQIHIDYENMARILIEAGSKKEVGKPQRERLYRITKKFNHLAAGIYPFALEMSQDGDRLISEKEFEDEERSLKTQEKKAKKRKFAEDRQNAVDVREERKAYRLAIKKKMKVEDNFEVEGDELPSDESETENDSTLNKIDTETDTSKEKNEKQIKNKKKDKVNKIKGSTLSHANDIKLKEDVLQNTKRSAIIDMDLEAEKNCVSNNLEQETPEVSPKDSEKTIQRTKITNTEASDLKTSETYKKKKKKKKSKNKLEKNITGKTDQEMKNSTIVNESTGNSFPITKESSSIPNSKEKSSKEKNSLTLQKSKIMIVSPEGSSTTEKLPEHNEKKKKAKDKTKNHGFDTVYSNETETLQIVKKHKPNKDSKKKTPRDKLLENKQRSSTSSESIDKNATKGNLFVMNEDWEEPLKKRESEIFIANPKYTGHAISPTSPSNTQLQSKKKKKAGKEKSSSDEVFGTPSITTPDKLPTPIFVKKAISKSGIDIKAQKLKKRNNIHSEPKRLSGDKGKPQKIDKSNGVSKRINFAISENKIQSLKEIDKSIQQSPDFQPFDARKRPAKGPILKTPPEGIKSSQNLTPLVKKKKQTVLYNTMINGKSKFARRSVASDFF